MEKREFENAQQTEKAGLDAGGDGGSDAVMNAKQKNITRPAQWSRAGSAVAKRIVEDVRRSLDQMTTGDDWKTCTVCLTVTGEINVTHEAGHRCSQSLCGGEDDEWNEFKQGLIFRAGYLCFGCLLPTVRSFDRPAVSPD